MADNIDLVSDITAGELDGGAAAPAPAGQVPAQGADAVPASAAPAKTEDKPSSLRDQLSAAFKDKSGDPTAQGDAANAGERARDPATGQFVPTQAEQDAVAAATAQPGTDAIQPPASFTPAEATQFATLPVEMQQLVARNMAIVENAAQRFAGYEGVEQVLGQRREAWAMNGMSEGQALNQVFAISDFATRAPADFIRWFAGTQQIDLNALAEQSGDYDNDIDPVVQELRQQVHELTSQVNGFTTGQQAAQHHAIVDEVRAFGAEMGTDSKPLRPYFAELGQGLLPYIAAVKAESPHKSHKDVLLEAYDRACWGTPSVRAKLVAAQEATRLEAQRTEAARAKAAGSSVNGQAPAPGSTVPKDIGNGSVRDTLRAAIAQHST